MPEQYRGCLFAIVGDAMPQAPPKMFFAPPEFSRGMGPLGGSKVTFLGGTSSIAFPTTAKTSLILLAYLIKNTHVPQKYFLSKVQIFTSLNLQNLLSVFNSFI